MRWGFTISTGESRSLHYARKWKVAASAIVSPAQSELKEEMAARKSAVASPVAEDKISQIVSLQPEHGVADPDAALKLIREDLGDCTRCKLHKGAPRSFSVWAIHAPS